MTVIDAIYHRRNITPDNFNGRIIPKETIEKLLGAANQAPTHGYTEPWRFVVYSGAGVQKMTTQHAAMYQQLTAPEKFSESTYLKIKHRGDLASHLIVAYMKRGSNLKIPRVEELCAVSCAIQNIWLLASSMQIGMYWGTGGMVHHQCMKDHFLLEEEDEMMGFLFLGYTDQEWPQGRRMVPLEEKIKWVENEND